MFTFAELLDNDLDVLEEKALVKKRVDRVRKRKSHIKYVKNKARTKIEKARARKKPAYKKYLKKKKKMGKFNKTSTGKKQFKWIG